LNKEAASSFHRSPSLWIRPIEPFCYYGRIAKAVTSTHIPLPIFVLAFYRSGTFHRRVPKDSVHFPVLDEYAARVFIGGLDLSLHPNLWGQSGVEDEISEVSFIYQVPKVFSECSAVHFEAPSWNAQ